MNYPHNRRTRALFVIVILLGGVFSLFSPARAQGIQITFEDSVPAGTVVENDAFLTGTAVTLDGEVEGDTFAVGSIIEVNGDVQGSLFAIGQNVVINGSVGGTTYVAAVTLELGPQAALDRNLYYLGTSLTSGEGSAIDRDLVIISMGVQLSGEIGRNTVGIIGPWELFKRFMDLIGRPIYEPQASLGSSGQLYSSQSEVLAFSSFLPRLGLLSLTRNEQGQPALKPTSIDGLNIEAQSDSSSDSGQINEWLLWVVRELVTLFIFGLIGIWLIPGFLKHSAQKIEAKPLQATGFGLLGLVLSIALVGVAILVGLLILMLGIGLGFLSLWDLAWAVWGIGFTSLSLVFWLSLLFVSYGTKVIVAYLVGILILGRLAPKANQYKILPLLLGLVIYVLLAWIPYFGWVIAVLANALGLGAAWLVYREKNQELSEEDMLEEEAESE
jgi:cytoskeletal protein CcmA (bactofilin family)